MTLALATAAHLELVDAARDARALQASFSVDPATALARLQQGVPTAEVGKQQGAAGVRVDEVVPIALLPRLAFFASRHQETSVSLQWKAAFVITPTLSYSLSSLSMTLNTLGPTLLIALGVPLLGIWNVAPLAVVPGSSSPDEPGLRATPAQEAQAPPLPMSQARVAVLAAVWAVLETSQVFAPRYMFGTVELLCVDVAMFVGLWHRRRPNSQSYHSHVRASRTERGLGQSDCCRRATITEVTISLSCLHGQRKMKKFSPRVSHAGHVVSSGRSSVCRSQA